MPATNAMYLPVDFNQLLSLARQLPDDEKQQLVDLLTQEETETISEEHQQLVLSRIKKYELQPQLMIEEEQAMKFINQL